MRRMLHRALNLLMVASLLFGMAPAAIAQPAAQGPQEPVDPAAPPKGTLLAPVQERILVLLADFPDQAHGNITPAEPPNVTRYSVDFSADHYRDIFFRGDEGYPSLRNYFKEQSYGRCIIQPEPMSSGSYVLDWGHITVTYPSTIYGNDDAVFGDDAGPDPGLGSDKKAHAFACEVITRSVPILDGMGFPWASYDRDNDGFLDHVVVIHAGRGQESLETQDPQPDVSPDSLYSRVGTLANPLTVGGGKQVNSYILVPEDVTVGLMARLLAQQMGAVDTRNTDARYATDETTGANESSAAFWDLMADGYLMGAPMGTYPANMNIWQRIKLGWIPPNEIKTLNVYSSPQNIYLDRVEGGGVNWKGIKIELPDYTVNRPHAGDLYWWSGKNPAGTVSLERDLDVSGEGPAVFSFWTWYDTEATGIHTDPAVIQFSATVTTTKYVSYGIGGQSAGWEQRSYDLSALFPGADTVHVSFTYAVDNVNNGEGWFLDDFTLTQGGTVTWSDEAESDLDSWTNNGWLMTAPQSYKHYYLAEWRSQAGFDRGYNHGVYYMRDQATGDAEYFSYNPGLMVWYVNERYAEGQNASGFRPGEGFLLPVDAHPAPLYRSAEVPWRAHVQMADAPFYTDSSLPQTLLGVSIPSLSPQATFWDASTPVGTYPYWNAEIPNNSVKTPRYGVKLWVEQHASDDSYGKIGFAIDAGRFETSSKAATPTVVVPGDPVTFTVTIRNTGADAYTTSLQDDIPAGTTYDGYVSASSGTASYDAGANRINWSGPVLVGTPVTVSFRVRVNSPAPNGSTISNTARIYESNSLKASPSCSVTISSSPDMSTSTKVCEPSEVRAGDPYTCTIVLRNTGTDQATTVTLTDTIPVRTAFIAGSLEASDGAASFDDVNNRIIWNGGVNVGSPVTVSFGLRVNEGTAAGTITNTAYVYDHINAPVPVSDTVTVLSAPNWDASQKSVTPTVARPGDMLTYTVTIHNSGNVAGSVYFTDSIPADTTYVSAENAAWNSALQRITWTGSLAPLASRIVTLRVRVDNPLDNGTIVTNTAEINDITRSVTTTITSEPDLSRSTKTALASSAASGGVLTYTITLSNTGTANANVCITDPIPANTELVPESFSYDVGDGSEGDGELTWCGPVNAGETVELTFQVIITLPPDETGNITNTVTIDDGVHAPFDRSVVTPVGMISLGCPEYAPFSGDTLDVPIRIDNVQALYGVETHISFDPSILQVDSIIIPGEEEAWFSPALWGPTGMSWDNTAGTITLAPVLRDGAAGVSGAGILCTIRFRAQAGGTTPLTVTESVLSAAPDELHILPIPHNVRTCGASVTERDVEGTVTLQGRDRPGFRDFSGVKILADGVQVATTDVNGRYRFFTPRPVFTITVQADGFLWAQRPFTATPTSLITLPDVNLRGGDVAGGAERLITRDASCVDATTPLTDVLPGPQNGVIDLVDLAFVAGKFGSRSTDPWWGPDPCYARHSADPLDRYNFGLAYLADINKDNVVNVHDLVYIGYNWNKAAPTLWP